MKKLLQMKFMLLLCALIVGSGTMWADKITDYTNIVSGKKYYIGATNNNGTDYYLSLASTDVGTGIVGTAMTDKGDANVFEFTGNGSTWTIKIDGTSNYLSLATSKANGKVNVVSSSANWTASNQSNKIRLASNDTYSLQKNNSGTQFGSYGNTQTDIWLEEATEDSPLASITLDVSNAKQAFHVGETFTHEGATVTANYENSSTKDVTSKATFSTPDMIAAGVKTVTVSYIENNVEKTTSYDITVYALTSITLDGNYPTEFAQGDTFSSEGIVVTAHYDDDTTDDVTANASFSGYDMSSIGNQTVTVSYTVGEVTRTATYNITVNEYVQPTEVDIALNDNFFGTNYGGSASGITDDNPVVGTKDNVKITYAGSGNHYINNSQIRFYPNNKLTFEAPTGYNITKIVFTPSTGGTWVATISANSGSYTSSTKVWEGEATSVIFTGSGSSRCDMANATITLEDNTPKELSSITLSGEFPTTFYVGDEFSHEGMIVTANYEGGKTKDVTASATFTGYDMSTTGEQTVTVSYTEGEVEKKATYNITVSALPALTSISLSGDYPTEFTQGDTFSSEGILVTANYENNITKDVTASATFTGYDMSTIGEQTVTVSYTEGEVTKTTTYGITVHEYVQPTEFVINLNNTTFGCEKGNNATEQSLTINNTIVIAGCSSTASNKTYYDANHVRFYYGSYLKLTAPTGFNITKVVFTSGGDWNGSISVEKGDYDNSIKTWEGQTDQLDFSFGLQNRIASVSITLDTPKPSISAENVNLAYNATEGYIGFTIDNPADDGTLTATFEDNEGDWLTLGEISDNTVPFTCSENYNGADRTATVRLTYTYETNKTVTKDVTITQAHYVIDYATLPFEFDKGKSDIDDTVGLTQSGLGSDYSSSPKLKFDGTNDCVILKINEIPGKLSFDIKGNGFSDGTFKVQTSADGVTYTDLKTYTSLGTTQSSEELDNLASNVRYIKWIYTEKVNGNVGLGNIKLDKVVTIAAACTYGDRYYSTFSSAKAFVVPEGLTVAEIGITDGKLDVSEYSTGAVVPANTGVMISTTTPCSLNITASSSAGQSVLGENNCLRPTGNGITAADMGDKDPGCLYYRLTMHNGTTIGFWWGAADGAAFDVVANKAYLAVPTPVTNARNGFTFDDDSTTGISNVNVNENVNGSVFDLQGRKVSKPGKGLYIVNGKKVVIK